MENISVRISDMRGIDEFTGVLKENRSETIRELLEEGRKMKALELYRIKKISLGLGARLAGMTLSEFIDLMKEFNVTLNLSVDDAKEALGFVREVL